MSFISFVSDRPAMPALSHPRAPIAAHRPVTTRPPGTAPSLSTGLEIVVFVAASWIASLLLSIVAAGAF